MDRSWGASGLLEQPSASLVGTSLALVALAALTTFLVRLFRLRMYFRASMRKHDIVSVVFLSHCASDLRMRPATCAAANAPHLQNVLPHSLVFGHLIHVGKALASYPRDLLVTNHMATPDGTERDPPSH